MISCSSATSTLRRGCIPTRHVASASASSFLERPSTSAVCTPTHYNGSLVVNGPTGRLRAFYGGDCGFHGIAQPPRAGVRSQRRLTAIPGRAPVSEQQLETPASKGRMTIYYVVLAVVTAVVAIVVISSGKDEKAQPSIAGGYDAPGPAACLGAPHPPATGAPLPATAPTEPAVIGPSFDVKQSGEFVNFSNTQDTLGAKLRLKDGKLSGDV